MVIKLIPLEERKTTFNEIEIGFTKEEALTEANRCLQCANPMCVQGCPANVNIPKFIKSFRDGNIEEAVEIIREKNFFPSICGRICQHEKQCEGNCILKNTPEGSVKIGAIERYIGDNTQVNIKPQLNGKQVAVIGSGPSGLSVAVNLAKAGINVKVFEVSNSFGGVIKYGVPEFRLPKKIVSKELTVLHNLGIDFEPNSKIAESKIDEVAKQFDAVFIGTGVGKARPLHIDGSELKRVSSAMKFLVNLNQSGIVLVKPGENVLVIGAGYVGIDAARSAIRLGTNVTCISILDKEKSLENVSEKDYLEAEEEGVKFIFQAQIIKLTGNEEGKVKKAFIKKDNVACEMDVDKVIYAIGQLAEKDEFKNKLKDEKGLIKVNEKYQTVIENVFAAGDCIHGPKTVIEAIDTGRKAADSIVEYLKNKK
ncbi:MAG: FAD-dependent oxidoreductase [Candidatus ainarchaeum sp.]|nr:FAD-dependent oxidoreductase [Candidatus ainarchaeum sp.]